VDDLAYASTFSLQDQKVPAEELVDYLLNRIAEVDDQSSPTAMRSVLALSPAAHDDAALRDRERRSGEPIGPLHGIPVLVKDNIEVMGMPATAGATSLAGRPAQADAVLVQRLRQAGAVVLGTTNLSEWANIRDRHSTSGWSAVGGLTVNPWALDRSAGGSSSGSGAAVAAGLAPLAVGTETDGSITCPSSLNGLAGIKPTVGFVPGAGIVPLSSSQDSAGPMARTVDEVALLLEVLSASSGLLEQARQGVGGLRIAVARNWRTGHTATDELFDETVTRLAAAGASVHDLDLASPGPAESEDEMTVMLCELLDGLAAYLPARGSEGPQDLAQVVEHERAHAATELAYFGHENFERALELGGTGTQAYREARARNLAWALGTCLEPALEGADVLISPTYGPAWKIDLVLGDSVARSTPVTMPPAIAGWPIATAPMGLAGGLPVGLGAVGRPGSEGLLLAVCRCIESPGRPTFRPPHRG